MKQTSIDKINKVYVAIKDHEEFKMYAELLKDVIRAEAMTPVKAGKFNIYNYVTKDQIRPSMCGVYHDKGMKVASDSHILIAFEEEYPEEFEGGVVLKDGSFVEIEEHVWDPESKETKTIKHRTSYVDKDGHNHPIFPKWRDIIPNIVAGGYMPYKFDREKFYKWVEGLRVAHKTEYGKGIKFGTDWFVKVGPCGFKAEWFNLMIEAMDFLGADQIYLHDEGRRAGVIKTDKGVCISMPILLAEDFSEDKPNHVILG